MLQNFIFLYNLNIDKINLILYKLTHIYIYKLCIHNIIDNMN